MKPCLHCGGKNRDQAKFCGHCGRAFTEATSVVTAVQSKPPRSSVRCHQCGKLTYDVERRMLHTGFSSGKSGTRAYFRLASVCPECARWQDEVLGIVVLVGVVLVLLFILAVAIFIVIQKYEVVKLCGALDR